MLIGGMGGILMPAFVDRSDPAAWNFTLADFTTDGNWHELDLSGIIPANAKAAALSLMVADDVVNSSVRLRRPGQTYDYNCSEIVTMVADTPIVGDFVTALSDNRKIEYRTSPVTFNGIILTVKGWWT